VNPKTRTSKTLVTASEMGDLITRSVEICLAQCSFGKQASDGSPGPRALALQTVGTVA